MPRPIHLLTAAAAAPSGAAFGDAGLVPGDCCGEVKDLPEDVLVSPFTGAFALSVQFGG